MKLINITKMYYQNHDENKVFSRYELRIALSPLTEDRLKRGIKILKNLAKDGGIL